MDLPLPEGYVAKVELPPGYRPRADEEYMSNEQLEYFRRKLAARLRDSEAFEAILLPPPSSLATDAVLVTGRMIEVSDPSDALGFFLGSNFWNGRVRARILLEDSMGRTLVEFEDSAQSDEGALPLTPGEERDADAMTAAMAGGTADAIVRWSKGEGLEPSLWQRLF